MPDHLTFQQRAYYFADLRAPDYQLPPEIDGYEGRVIEQVRQWLLGVDAFALRTSGSTGPAKEIVLTRTQLAASARRSVQALGLQPGQPALVCLSVETAGGLLGIVRALLHDLPLTVVAPTADVLHAAGPASHFATTSLVPLQLHAVLRYGAAGVAWLNRMHAVLIGGAAVDAALEAAVQNLSAPFYHTYGMTETASHVALRRLNGPDRTDFFTALPGVELALGENEALRLRADVTGHEWLQTTDRAELVGASSFYWRGRLDDVINSGGVKIDAARVQRLLEVCVAQLGLPHPALVVGVPDARYGQRVVAALEGEIVDKNLLANLQQVLAERLSRYENPKEIRVIAAFPRLPGGKIDRLAVRSSWQAPAALDETDADC